LERLAREALSPEEKQQADATKKEKKKVVKGKAKVAKKELHPKSNLHLTASSLVADALAALPASVSEEERAQMSLALMDRFERTLNTFQNQSYVEGFSAGSKPAAVVQMKPLGW
jgi:hypothetical protein